MRSSTRCGTACPGTQYASELSSRTAARAQPEGSPPPTRYDAPQLAGCAADVPDDTERQYEAGGQDTCYAFGSIDAKSKDDDSEARNLHAGFGERRRISSGSFDHSARER